MHPYRKLVLGPDSPWVTKYGSLFESKPYLQGQHPGFKVECILHVQALSTGSGTFMFRIPAAMQHPINQRKHLVHVRCFSMSSSAELYPASLHVNSTVLPVPPVPAAKLSNFSQPFQSLKPLDITRWITRSADQNIYTLFPLGSAPSVPKSFGRMTPMPAMMVVQVVSPMPFSELQPYIPLNALPLRSSAAKDEDEAIQATVEEVSLLCPLSVSRIQTPVKGLICKHIQCFDLEYYLTFCTTSHRWSCPVCLSPLPACELTRDTLFTQILASVRPSVEKIRVDPDGTWSVPETMAVVLGPEIGQHGSSSPSPSRKRDRALVTISLESDEETPPPKQGRFPTMPSQPEIVYIDID